MKMQLIVFKAYNVIDVTNVNKLMALLSHSA